MPVFNTPELELKRRRMKKDYGEYVEWVNPGFYMTHFHRYLCDEIQTFLEHKTTLAMEILLLSVPPRHGKSFTVTETLPSWFLGKNPMGNVIICGYESKFAESFSRRNRDKYNDYACDIFGCDYNKNVQGVSLWETSQGGRCRAAGLAAGITGFGANLFIIDDPIKNQEAAESESILGKILDEMGPSVQSRIQPHGKLIVIQTRWVENDVIGFIENKWSDFVYKKINLPCECEDPEHDPLGRKLGESLMGPHLGDYNLPDNICNDNTWLKSKKALVLAADGEHTWNALYQGHPSAKDGNLFQAGWWQSYSRDKIKSTDFDYLVLSVDATFKESDTSDMVSIQLWGLAQNHVYLYKLINKRMGFVATCDAIRKVVKEFPNIDQLLIEEKANGAAIIEVLRNDEGIPSIVPVNPLGGKYSRAQAVSPFVSTKAVHLPNDFTPIEALDVESDSKTGKSPRELFIEQHSQFPYAAHDDMVDAMTQALSRLIKLVVDEEAIPERRYIRFTHWYPDMWEDYERMNEYEQQEFIRTYGAPEEWEDL